MANCKKCGAYIPIGDTACPACGYDPEAEARQEREAKERAEREARRKAQEQSWAEQERKREQEARQREEQRRRQEEQRRQQSYSGSATQSQYGSQNRGQTWVPPWSQNTSQSGYQQNTYQSSYQSSYRNTDSYTGMQDRARDSVENQRLSVLSYLGPLFFVPLLARGNDPFARFHANQGLVLFLTNAILGALVGWPLRGMIACFNLFCTVRGIINVLHGKMEPLPIIGSIRLLK